MNNFITNSDKRQLKTRLIELLSKSDGLKFLIGFFYFSRLIELFQSLKANELVNLKILVGLNVDKTVYGLFEYGEFGKPTNKEPKNLYVKYQIGEQ